MAKQQFPAFCAYKGCNQTGERVAKTASGMTICYCRFHDMVAALYFAR